MGDLRKMMESATAKPKVVVKKVEKKETVKEEPTIRVQPKRFAKSAQPSAPTTPVKKRRL